MSDKERFEKMLKDYYAVVDKVAEIQKENPEVRFGIDCTTVHLHGDSKKVFDTLEITDYVVEEYPEFTCLSAIYKGKYLKGIITKNGNWKENSNQH